MRKNLLAYGGWFLAGVMVAMGAQKSPAPPDLVVRSITVVDRMGVERVSIGAAEKGAAIVKLADINGKKRLELSTGTHSQFAFYNGFGNPVAALLEGDGNAFLTRYPRGKPVEFVHIGSMKVTDDAGERPDASAVPLLDR